MSDIDTDISGTVELIASGYEWECPSCEDLKHEIEASEEVYCVDCDKHFKVMDYYHATRG